MSGTVTVPVYYYWFNVRLVPEHSPASFIEYWQPLSMAVSSKDGMTSILFSSTQLPHSFYSWKTTVRWYALGWMNECMAYPANLGYVQTLESFNTFVACYGGSAQLIN